MSDHIQKNGEFVAIVVYEEPLPPRYFRLSKKFLRTLLFTFPIVLFTLLFTLFIWGLTKRVKEIPAPELPSIISSSDNKLDVLNQEIKALEDSNRLLLDKLSQVSAKVEESDPYLSIIKKPYGMRSLISEGRIKLEQLEFIANQDKLNLKFNIVNSFSSRVTGYIIVLMSSDFGFFAYPKEMNSLVSEGVKFNNGEPFSVSRLRPTNAGFNLRISAVSNQNPEVKFSIYIFNREGDLLLIKETEKYKMGPGL